MCNVIVYYAFVYLDHHEFQIFVDLSYVYNNYFSVFCIEFKNVSYSTIASSMSFVLYL